MGRAIVKSSGNVSGDLGFPPDEAAILQRRSDLMADLREFIAEKKLTHSWRGEQSRCQSVQSVGSGQGKVGEVQARDADHVGHTSRHAHPLAPGRIRHDGAMVTGRKTLDCTVPTVRATCRKALALAALA